MISAHVSVRDETSPWPPSARPKDRRAKTWTVADLYRRFGPIPFERIRQDPPPGCGTVDDVVRLNDHEDRLYELVDGILVEKTVGLEESFIAGKILTLLNIFVEPRELGLVAGEGGTIQLDINLVRIPDVSFISLGAAAGRRDPRRTGSPARPRPGRRGHQPEQHPQGDGREAPGVLREGGPPGLVCAARRPGSSTSTRRRTASPG